MKNTARSILTALVVLTAFLPTLSFAQTSGVNEIKVGKWAGYLKMDGATDAIALKMDSYYVEPNDFKDFQYLRLVFKMSLGGYLSPEYETETFNELQYDWYSGVLTLDEPKNQMVVRATVTGGLRPKMEGTVEIRRSTPPASGKIFLQYRGDGPADWDSPEDLVPSLAGQYEGTCGGKSSVLQLETGKGLTREVPVMTTGLHHYNITGGMGIENGYCPRTRAAGLPSWCGDHVFTAATYDFFQSKLYLTGIRHTDECSRNGGELICKTEVLTKTAGGEVELVPDTCRFKKQNAMVNSKFKIFPRLYSLTPSDEQSKSLPSSGPKEVKDLAAAMDGTYFGYLHHEYRDRYQPIQLKSVASISTDNTHNQNEVFVSVSSVQHFGRGISSDMLANQFDRRASWLVLGYLLASEESDVSLQVLEWKRGFISGVWYSKDFGRVGTFEVVKEAQLPPLDRSAQTVPPLAGNFRGPKEADRNWYWNLKTVIPKQPRGANSFLVFQGNYWLYTNGFTLPLRPLRGAYDVYTGNVFWLADSGRGEDPQLVTGNISGVDQLNLFWPSERSDMSVEVSERKLETFVRAKN